MSRFANMFGSPSTAQTKQPSAPSSPTTAPASSSAAPSQASSASAPIQRRNWIQSLRNTISKRRTYDSFRLNSGLSSTSVPDSGFAAVDFMLGAGMVIIQPSTRRIVVCYIESPDSKRLFFFPKGRKDVGESLEQAAVREAREEGGYKDVEHFPLYKMHRQPVPPGRERFSEPDTEAVFISITKWGPKLSGQQISDYGGEYFTFWYVGYLPDKAEWTAGTGMADEQDYRAVLLSYEDARAALLGTELESVLEHAWSTFLQHEREVEARRKEKEQEPNGQPA